MIGYNLNEIRNKTYQDITPQKWHEFEEDIVNNQYLAQGFTEEYEKEYIHKDGHIFPVSLRGWVINNEENEQDMEVNGRNNEKVHCGNYITMILKKCHPRLLFLLVRMFCSISS